MNIIRTLWQRSKRVLQHGSVIVALALSPLMSAQAASGVPVDQSPLILAKPLAPNIVLMFDDSASMGWDFMPDAEYLLGSTTGKDRPEDDDLRAYQVNQIYYNPNTTYTPPYEADGTPYPDSTFPKAISDGFHAVGYRNKLPDGTNVPGAGSNQKKNITIYSKDTYWYTKTSSSNNFKPYSSGGFHYWKYVSIPMPTGTCPTGTTIQDGACVAQPTKSAANNTCPSGYTYDASDNLCHYSGATSTKQPTYSCSSGKLNGQNCYVCPSGVPYNSSTGLCSTAVKGGNYTCPTGTSLNADKTQCSGPAKGGTYSCPTGLTYNGGTGQCSAAAIPASYSCPSGLSYDSGSGQCVGSPSAAYDSCPNGLTYAGNSTCSASAQGGTYSCPSGFTNNGSNVCQKFLTGEQCPTGSTLQNGYCTVAATYTPPSCSVGTLSSDQKTCTAPSTHHDASCTNGTLSGNQCVAPATPVPASCPNGNGTLSPDQTTCTATATYTAPYCNTGSSLSGNTCTATPTYHAQYCPTGTTQNGSLCTSNPTQNPATPKCASPYVLQNSGQYAGMCLLSSDVSTASPTQSCSSGDLVSGLCYVCPAGTYYSTGDSRCEQAISTSCPTGWSAYSSKTKCRITAFSYNAGSAKPYTSYYVLPATTSCYGVANCTIATDTSGTYAPAGVEVGTNIANWFSYYRNRMLLAKTGLSMAFSSLDPSYRFGFGSLNGAYTKGLPTNQYPFKTDTKDNNALAEVEAFGDGSTGTQKANFWNWLIGEFPISQTPTRQALNAVGQYYETDQPWQTSATDTSMYSCRSSATILTTDGFYNDSFSGINNVDGTAGPSITTPSNYQYAPKDPYQDTYSDTLADVAMKYWETDLRSDLTNDVKTTPNDPAFWQHMTTYTMGLGWDPTPLLNGLTVPEIFSWANTGTAPTSYAGGAVWPQPDGSGQGVINNIADLAHAAVDGHGDFFSVKNPAELVAGLKSALASIGDAQGAGSAVTNSAQAIPGSTTSTPLDQFRVTYFTGQWTGTLTASHWDTTATPPGFTLDWSTNSWAPPSYTSVSSVSVMNRNVWTTKDGSSSGSVAFQVAGDLSSAQQTQLGSYPGTSDQTMINYLLGDSTYDTSHTGGTLRARKTILGDVVSSTPVYVAAPDGSLFQNATFPGAPSYPTFVTNNKTRTPLVYVAANDGMLHAIRVQAGAGWTRDSSGAVTTVASQPAGTEVYAYMPSAVLTQTGDGSITNLANPKYGQTDAVSGTQAVPHQYYNDGRITVQNVYFSSDSKWHTVLVGTTGRGPAKAIYALDITAPTVLMDPDKAKNALLWERSADDGQSGSSYIGEMVGAPVIAQIEQGGKTSWAVFVGNGYNSAANTPALLQFNLQTGALSVHTAGAMTNDGLAEPGLMQSNTANGISTYAFAGDLNGNLWKFDLSTNNSAGSVAFVAKDANNKTQPITSLVTLAFDSATNSTFALFGTGKYLSQTVDTPDTQVQTWYGVRVGMGADLSGASVTTTPVASSSTTRSNLAARYAVDNSAGDRATSAQSSATDMDNKAGWYMDLPQSGERIVNRTQLIGSLAVVTTLIPKVKDLCNTVPSGAVMFVDPFTGANQGSDLGLGTTSITYKDATGKTVTTTVAINGKVFGAGPAAGVTGVMNGDGTVSLSFNTLNGGLATLGPIKQNGISGSRVSWRELTN